MSDPYVGTALADAPDGPPVLLARVDTGGTPGAGLPLAKARNAGAELAMAAGAEQLVFLDVDCIPGPRLVERYAACLRAGPPALFSGPVSYLPPPPLDGYDLHQVARGRDGHPGRPVPPDDTVVRGADHRLFWSLSFAVDRSTWQQLGGFCERYDGYGAEDTDFGQIAAAQGIPHAWVGGAWAYHQHHPSQDPPVQHATAILKNAAIFHARWGWWPMEGWLEAFAERGLAGYDAERDLWWDPSDGTVQRARPGLAEA